jgi:hypothetical protein
MLGPPCTIKPPACEIVVVRHPAILLQSQECCLPSPTQSEASLHVNPSALLTSQGSSVYLPSHWSPATTPSSRCHGFVTAWAAISHSNMVCIGAGSIHTRCHGQNRLSDRNLLQTVNRNSRLTKLQHVPCATAARTQELPPNVHNNQCSHYGDMSCQTAGYTGLACPDASTTGCSQTDTTNPTYLKFCSSEWQACRKTSACKHYPFALPGAQPRDTTWHSPQVW